jgi:hypothetical protein
MTVDCWWVTLTKFYLFSLIHMWKNKLNPKFLFIYCTKIWQITIMQHKLCKYFWTWTYACVSPKAKSASRQCLAMKTFGAVWFQEIYCNTVIFHSFYHCKASRTRIYAQWADQNCSTGFYPDRVNQVCCNDFYIWQLLSAIPLTHVCRHITTKQATSTDVDILDSTNTN